MIICKVFFPINGNSFQRKPKLYLPLIFHSSVMVISEIVFMSEQITENKFGVVKTVTNLSPS